MYKSSVLNLVQDISKLIFYSAKLSSLNISFNFYEQISLPNNDYMNNMNNDYFHRKIAHSIKIYRFLE
jgi:hypothetical protein